jgi:hypothetical protein
MGVIFQSSKDAQELRVCLGGGGEEDVPCEWNNYHT